MSRGLTIVVCALLGAAIASAALGSTSLDTDGDIMKQALADSGLPTSHCDDAWSAYAAQKNAGAAEPQAFAAALDALPIGERAALVAAYANAHGNPVPGSTTPIPGPQPQPQPGPGPKPGPGPGGITPSGPANLVAAATMPAGGWSGGRAIIAQDIPPWMWLSSNGWPEGTPESSSYLVPGYQWFPRDRFAVENWDARGLVVFGGFSWVMLPTSKGDLLEVEISNTCALLGGDVRLTVSMLAAQAIADRHGCMLPTAQMVDACWRARRLNLPWHPLVPAVVDTNHMASIAASLVEDDLVMRDWRHQAGGPASPEMASTWGKSYTLTPSLAARPDVANIYGWFDENGRPIQSPNTGGGSNHPVRYFDYSHTFQIVKPVARLNGSLVSLPELFRTRPDLVGGPRFGGQPCPTRQPLVLHRSPDGTVFA